ncbi:MAG: hypothetical protein R3F43_16340 [bacterium]
MTLLRLCEQGPTLPLAEVLSGLARLEGRLDHPYRPMAAAVDRRPRGRRLAWSRRGDGMASGPRAEAPATVPSRPGCRPRRRSPRPRPPRPAAPAPAAGPAPQVAEPATAGSAALAVEPEPDDLPPGPAATPARPWAGSRRSSGRRPPSDPPLIRPSRRC